MSDIIDGTVSNPNGMATAKQVSFMGNLLRYRQVPDELRKRTLDALDRGPTRDDAATLIGELRACPDKVSDADYDIALGDVRRTERSIADAVWDQNR